MKWFIANTVRSPLMMMRFSVQDVGSKLNCEFTEIAA